MAFESSGNRPRNVSIPGIFAKSLPTFGVLTETPSEGPTMPIGQLYLSPFGFSNWICPQTALKPNVTTTEKLERLSWVTNHSVGTGRLTGSGFRPGGSAP